MVRDFLGGLLGVVNELGMNESQIAKKRMREAREDVAENFVSHNLFEQNGEFDNFAIREGLREYQRAFAEYQRGMEYVRHYGLGEEAQQEIGFMAMELQKKQQELLNTVEYALRETDGVLYDANGVNKRVDRGWHVKGRFSEKEWDYLYSTIGHLEMKNPYGEGNVTFGRLLQEQHDAKSKAHMLNQTEFNFIDPMDENYMKFYNKKKDKWISYEDKPHIINNYKRDFFDRDFVMSSMYPGFYSTMDGMIEYGAKLAKTKAERKANIKEIQYNREAGVILDRLAACGQRNGMVHPTAGTSQVTEMTEYSGEVSQTDEQSFDPGMEDMPGGKKATTQKGGRTTTKIEFAPGANAIESDVYGMCKRTVLKEMNDNGELKNNRFFTPEYAEKFLNNSVKDIDSTKLIAPALGVTEDQLNFISGQSDDYIDFMAESNNMLDKLFTDSETGDDKIGYIHRKGDTKSVPTHLYSEAMDAWFPNPEAYAMAKEYLMEVYGNSEEESNAEGHSLRVSEEWQKDNALMFTTNEVGVSENNPLWMSNDMISGFYSDNYESGDLDMVKALSNDFHNRQLGVGLTGENAAFVVGNTMNKADNMISREYDMSIQGNDWLSGEDLLNGVMPNPGIDTQMTEEEMEKATGIPPSELLGEEFSWAYPSGLDSDLSVSSLIASGYEPGADITGKYESWEDMPWYSEIPMELTPGQIEEVKSGMNPLSTEQDFQLSLKKRLEKEQKSFIYQKKKDKFGDISWGGSQYGWVADKYNTWKKKPSASWMEDTKPGSGPIEQWNEVIK